MLNLLWGYFVDYVVPAVVTGGIIAIVIIYYKFAKGKVKKHDKNQQEEVVKKVVKPKIVEGYINSKAKYFLEVLNKALPEKYIVQCNVSCELLFSPLVRKDMGIRGQYVDFCIYNKDFVPVLVIDLVDINISMHEGGLINEDVINYLKKVNIGYLEVTIKDAYSIDEIRLNIARSLNPLI